MLWDFYMSRLKSEEDLLEEKVALWLQASDCVDELGVDHVLGLLMELPDLKTDLKLKLRSLYNVFLRDSLPFIGQSI
jgi:hypothetical protein